MKVFYSDHHVFGLPSGHRFPAQKYPLLRRALIQRKILSESELQPSPFATREIVTLAHTPEYYDGIYNGTIDPKIMRQIGLPWSFELVKRSLASLGGSILAAENALDEGLSGNLAGGTHHALADQGAGFCVFNDTAVTTLYLLKHKRIRRVAIIDLDVHQGNGNAAILGSYPDQVYVFSMHGEKNYPFRKVPSTLDIHLPDYTGDEEYLAQLEQALPQVFAFRPEIVLYLAGVDPLITDRLGRLSLTLSGLARRDWLVLSECHRRGIPTALVLGGGYAVPIDHTVEAHLQTYQIARDIFG